MSVEQHELEAIRLGDWQQLLRPQVRTPHRRFLSAWAAIALGEPPPLDALRELIADDDGAWVLHLTAGLWPFRKQVGVDRLLEWQLHSPLIERLWRAAAPQLLGDRYRGLRSDFHGGFLADWLSPELTALVTNMAIVLPTPWHLGSARPMVEAVSERKLLRWARRQAEALPLDEADRQGQRWLDEGIDFEPNFAPEQHVLSDDTDEHGSPLFENATRPFHVFEALAGRKPLIEVLGCLGRAVALTLSPEARLELARDLERRLLIEDVRARLPPDAHSRSKSITEVLFRATPRRAVDAAVVRLKGGTFGTLARHPGVGPGGVQMLTFTEGNVDEALAAVPELHFAEAVVALKR